MATPVFQAATDPAASFSGFFLAWPTHIANDIGLLVVENAGNGSTVSITGWQTVPGSPVVDVASTAGSKLQVFYKRAASAFESDAFIPDSGDHQIARLYTFRNCIATGSPWDVTTTGIKTTASFTATVPAVTTTVVNTLITMIVGRPDDSGSLSHFGVPFNPVLTSIQELGEAGSSIGNGGGFVVSTGIKASAGNTSTSALSKNFSTTDTYMVIAFKGELPANVITPAVRAFSLTGNAATLKQNVVFTANTGTFNFTGNAATLVKAAAIKLLLANAGTFALNGQPVTLRQNFKVEAVAGLFALNSNQTAFRHDYLASAIVGTFALTGEQSQLYQNYLLSADAGSFLESGEPVSFARDRQFAANAGVFVFNGNNVQLIKISTFSLNVGTGNFVLFGKNVVFATSKNITADSGSFIITGNSVSLFKTSNIVINASRGIFTFNGNNAAFARNRNVDALAGQFIASGSNINLARTLLLNASTGSIIFSGLTISLQEINALTLPVELASFVLVGKNTTLTKTVVRRRNVFVF